MDVQKNFIHDKGDTREGRERGKGMEGLKRAGQRMESLTARAELLLGKQGLCTSPLVKDSSAPLRRGNRLHAYGRWTPTSGDPGASTVARLAKTEEGSRGPRKREQTVGAFEEAKHSVGVAHCVAPHTRVLKHPDQPARAREAVRPRR